MTSQHRRSSGDARRPPVLELIERVSLKVFARIGQPKITWTERHEGHDGASAKAGWKPPKYSAAHDGDPGPNTRVPEAADTATHQPERGQPGRRHQNYKGCD